MEEILDQAGVVVGAVDVAVEGLGGYEVERVGSVFIIRNFNIEGADAITNRSEVHHGLIFNELTTGYAVGRVPNVVNLSFNSKLVAPGDSGRSVSNELGVDVRWFSHPAIERVLFNAVGTGITGRIGVDDARGVDGDDAIVREAKETLRHLDFVGVDALENTINQQGNIVSQDG